MFFKPGLADPGKTASLAAILTRLHTIDATQTLNRILGFFDQEEERQIRIRLSGALRWVVSQRLLPRIDQGRVAVFEIMLNNLRVQDLILHGESTDKTFYEIIETSQPFACQTFDQDIIEKFEKGMISEETARLFASKRANIRRGMDQIKSRRGQKTTSIKNLALDQEYLK